MQESVYMHHIWALSLDGNVATQRAATALADAIALVWRQTHKTDVTVKYVRALPPPNAIQLEDSTVVTWTKAFPAETAAQCLASVACIEGDLLPPWPDIVVPCRPEVSALALSIKAASGGKTKIAQIRNPNNKAGTYRFDLRAFDLIIRQPQDAIRGDNIISSSMALHNLTAAASRQLTPEERALLLQFGINDQAPLIVVFVGGTDENIHLSKAEFTRLSDDIRTYAERYPHIVFVIMTSRRTGELGEHILQETLATAGNVRVNQPNNYSALLTRANAFMITSDSLSMVTESMSTGKPCLLLDIGGILRQHTLTPLFDNEVAEGRLTWGNAKTDIQKFLTTEHRTLSNEAPELARQVLERLGML